MRSLTCIILFWLSQSALISQIHEDFSDGELANDPRWWGTTDQFLVNSEGYLQLSSTTAGNAYVSAILGEWKIEHWSFDLKMGFNPSVNNFCQIYLMADGHILDKPLNGYFLMIGGSNDEISLYRQDGSAEIKILDGPDGLLDSPSLEISVLLQRTSDGKWDLSVTDSRENMVIMSGEVNDARYDFSYFFGLSCTYTITRADQFYFDNIDIQGAFQPDNQPPVLNNLASADSMVILTFDEPVWPELSTFQFTISGITDIETVSTDNNGKVILCLSRPLQNNSTYTVTGNDIPDLADNLTSFQQSFQYTAPREPKPIEVIITEVMADPQPPVSNFNSEYIEIYNRTDQPLNLGSLMIADMTRSVPLPPKIIEPGEFLILYPQSENPLWGDSISTFGLSSWPSLNNNGDLISLISADETLHFVDYTLDWYRSELKKHGGWSLEMIDTEFPCSGASNWAASVSRLGGTPGYMNSIQTDNPDLSPPKVVNSFATSPDTICMIFDEIVDPKLSNFQVNISPARAVDRILVEDTRLPKVTIVLKESLAVETIYTMRLSDFADCHGNRLKEDGLLVPIALPSKSDSADLLISEILFNPRPLGTRFVEIYNPTEKAFDLKDMRLARFQNHLLIDFRVISNDPLMIYPGEYKALTEDIMTLQTQYPQSDITGLIEIGDLPTLPDNRGSIVISNLTGIILDELEYDQDMHHRLLADRNGVSLERVSFRLPTNLGENWASASELAGYATPGSPNSQHPSSQLDLKFEIYPEILDRRKLGQSSYAQMRYRFSTPGHTISIFVYDAQGRMLVKLLENSIAGAEGLVYWDGTGEDHLPLKMGVYLIIATTVDPGGSVRVWKEPLVIAPNY